MQTLRFYPLWISAIFMLSISPQQSVIYNSYTFKVDGKDARGPKNDCIQSRGTLENTVVPILYFTTLFKYISFEQSSFHARPSSIIDSSPAAVIRIAVLRFAPSEDVLLNSMLPIYAALIAGKFRCKQARIALWVADSSPVISYWMASTEQRALSTMLGYVHRLRPLEVQ